MTLAIVCLTCLFAVFGGIIFAVLRMTGGEEDKEDKQKGQRRRGALDRMQQGDDDAAEDEGDADDDRQGGRHNERRDARRQERRADADAERQARQDRQKQLDEKQEKYNQKQREKEAEFLKKEEAEKKVREEKEKKEQEEFEKWKELFSVEAEGEDAADGIDGGAVERFIDYVKVRKVVSLEDLAVDFRMRTSAAIDRLKELERQGRISGIFDDRGKFIFITVEEMASMAEWLKNKGRINRADLVAACNKIVRLNPTAEDKVKLQQEASSAVDALDSTQDS